MTSVLWLLASCGSDSRTNAPASPTLQSITVSPKTATVAQFGRQQFAAEGHYSDGSTKALNNVAWTLDNKKGQVTSTGLVEASDLGLVIVTATSGGFTGSAALTIERRIITEGSIPADFTVAKAMSILYGNFDGETKSSIADLPPLPDSSLTLPKQNETYPFFIGQVTESGGSKIFFGTYASAEGYCHACAVLIGMAVFVRGHDDWVVESATKKAIFDGEWGEPPTPRILRIGPSHAAVELEVAGFYSNAAILVPWNGEIRGAFSEIVGEGNGQVCSDESSEGDEDSAPQPCVRSDKKISFAPGANPDYYDMILTLSGTTLAEEKPYKLVTPYKILQVSGSERRIFAEGKYVPVAPKSVGSAPSAN